MKRTDCQIINAGCEGVDSPITNTSAEAPDPLLFAGVGWTPYDPYRPPPLGGGVNVPVDCSNITWSDVSQEMADLLAKINAITCQPPAIPNGYWPPLPPFPPFPPFSPFPPLPDLVMPDFVWTPPAWNQPPGPDYQQFYNTAQSATATCPNGALFTYTVLASAIVSSPMPPALGPVWVQLANAWAEAAALQQVWALRACIDVPFVYFRFPPFDFTSIPPYDWPTGLAWPPPGWPPPGWPTIGPNPPFGWPPGVAWPPLFNSPIGWPPGVAWPPIGWPPGVAWPIVGGVGTTPPAGWPVGRAWPPPSPRGPTLSANPGYICLGSALDPILNKYTVSGTGSFTFSIIAGSLAPGTALVSAGPSAVEVQGTPITTGEYTYTLLAVRDGMPGVQVEVTDTLWVFGLVTSTIPDITVGTPYSFQLVAGGGTNPVSFQDVSVLPNGLPPGLVMNAAGLISGTPTGTGTGKFQVQITDEGLEPSQCTQEVTIGFVPPPSGLDWTTLVWGAFYNTCIPAVPPSGTFSGASFSVSANGGTSSCNDPAGPSAAACDGTLLYNGPAVPANLHVVAAPLGNPGASHLSVDVNQDGNYILSFSATSGSGGTFDIPFTVADTGGIPSTIIVTVSWIGGAFMGDAGSVTGNGHLT